MIYVVKELLKRETAADKREFVKGYMGTEANVRSVVAGVIAGWLLTGGPKK
jgi:hypothetical protein